MSVNKGQKVAVHYVGTLDDGTEFDNSRTRGEPLKFEFGAATIMPAFQDAISEMNIGEIKKIEVEPDQAYGPINPDAYTVVPLQNFKTPEDLVVGSIVHGQNASGQRFAAKIDEISQDSVKLDFNHPMAGKKLSFEIELISAS